MSDCYKFWRWPARHQALQIELANEKTWGTVGCMWYITIYIYVYAKAPPQTYLGP